jgi:uncharacterized protein (TIGR00661 family)
MRILYGVVGEGMGHATRSRVVIEHLLAQGHQVHVFVSGRAHDLLRKHFTGVHRVHGWHLVYADNEVDKSRTASSNLWELRHSLPLIAQAIRELDSFRPEVVLSDFESWSYVYAQAHNLPVISIDNMQVLSRCTQPDDVIAGHLAEFLLAKGIVRAKLPMAQHYVVTTFFFPELRKDRTTLVPPILRPEVLAAKPREGEHVLVYSSAEGSETLEATLREFPGQTFLVYGVRRGIAEEQVDGHLRHQPFSERGFIDHLASARAVVAGGGFSLLSECVYLHKPVLSVPLSGQFEQLCNARWLQRLGWGLCRESVAPDDVAELIDRANEFGRALGSWQQDGNRRTFEVVDALLAGL